jgi:ADP-heptose:LPS heptosyltransferase
MAHMVGVPGPIDLATDVAIPPATRTPDGAMGKIVLHNDPSIDRTKAWSWSAVNRFVRAVGPKNVVLLGSPGPDVPGALDLRGRTSLAETAAVIRAARCYVGIDSGLMWIAGSLQVPAVGLYGTSYIAAYGAIQPKNPHAVYIQDEGNIEDIRADDVISAVRGRLDGQAAHNHVAAREPWHS